MDNIHILWVSDNRDTAVNMITMYALNSKKNNWWKNVNNNGFDHVRRFISPKPNSDRQFFNYPKLSSFIFIHYHICLNKGTPIFDKKIVQS
jgi:hypothetical protein